MRSVHEPIGQAKAAGLPTGTVTFLFSDVEGSTQRWERDREAMAAALRRHDEVVRSAIEGHGGHVFKTVGDEFCAVFSTAPEAVAAALDVARALAAEDFTRVGGIRVRIALNTGDADERSGDYFGPAVNRVARLLAIGHGGQVLVAGVTTDLVQGRLPPQATLQDLGQHRLRDLIFPEQVYQLRAPGLQADFPPLRSLGSLPNNLPLQVTSLVGRDAEVAEIEALLVKSRLVTIVGSGGVGKTRASLQVGANLLDGSGDGVWLVELAPLTDGALVPSTIASVLGIQLPAEGEPVVALARALRAQHLLLILDNCEHLIDAVARVADAVLRECPHVSILASSRQGLGIAGEATYRMPSLAVPERDATETLRAAQAARFGAVALFTARAEAADARFQLTDDNAPIIADICRRLDGIALAIELAAARVKVLSPHQLRQRLDERFRILTGGSRMALPRQQTLRALIDWSHDLLDDRERTIFRRLGIYAESFALDAVSAVCADPSLDDYEVFDVVASLVEKSLVVPELGGESPRYRLLESTRAYAREKLQASGERERQEERRLDYLIGLFERAQRQVDEIGREEGVLALATELEDVRAALDWAAAHGEPARCAQLLATTLLFNWLGLFAETVARCNATLALLGDSEPLLASKLSILLATVYRNVHRARDSYEAARCAVDFARASGDEGTLRSTLIAFAGRAGAGGWVEEARAALDEAYAMQLPLTIADRLQSLAAEERIAASSGELAIAIERAEESIALHRSFGNDASRDKLNLAETLYETGATDRAIAQVRELLATAPPRHFVRWFAMSNLAGYLVAAGKSEEAVDSVRQVIASVLKTDATLSNLAIPLQHLALALGLLGDTERSARLDGFCRVHQSADGFAFTERASNDRLDALLRGGFEPQRLDELRAEGAAWSADRAIEEALSSAS